MSSEDNPGDASFFSHQYKIPSIESDISRWDGVWEKTLRTLSASEDVFPLLSKLWDQDRPEIASFTTGLHNSVCGHQDVVARIVEEMEEEDHFMTVWMLLDDAERKRHLLKGLKEACDQASLRQDGRALCPEITTKAMLKQNGMPFVEFVRNLAKGIRESGGEGRVYMLPSEWWQSAVTMPEPWSDEVKFAFKQLSLQRNEFLGEYSHFGYARRGI